MLNRLKIIWGNRLLHVLPVSRCLSLKRAILRWSGVRIGPGVRIWSTANFYHQNIEIGKGTFIGHRVQLLAHPKGKISIGKNCDIAPEVMFHSGTHAIGSEQQRAGQGLQKSIQIGDGCWIGTRAIILAGVAIGNGSVIAAGAVVAKDIPANCLVGGVPARVIRNLN